MENKETLLQTLIHASMLEDTEYFKYIFKKTEKIACAVFYVLRSNTVMRHEDRVVEEVETGARELLDVSLASLRSTDVNIDGIADDLRYVLIRFESKLRLAHAARIVSSEFLEVFIHEIDSVQRSLKKYIDRGIPNPLDMPREGGEAVSSTRRLPRVREERSASTTHRAVAIGEGQQSRRDRVLNVLRDKGEATIKDIIEVVTDCSEKTIQRELISLIKNNIVHREGERRWSKYRII